MYNKSKVEVTLLALFLISATFAGIHISIAEAETPSQSPFLMCVHLQSIYSISPMGSESWGHEVIFQVGDPDGVDNLFMDGEVSFSILSPDGVTHPLPGEHVEVDLAEGEPDTLWVLWFEWFSGFPVFGEYTITVWDTDGLSATYTTFPTKIEDVPTTVPTITYPPNFGAIYETIPTFTWETYVPEKGSVASYGIGVHHENWSWTTNVGIPPDETSVVFNFDGSSPVAEIPPGNYLLIFNADIYQEVVYEEERYIEIIDFAYCFREHRGAEAYRSHMFTVAPTWEYVFEDSCRDTILKISTEDQYFQFIGPDKTFSIKHDPNMTVKDHFISINFEDSEIILHAVAIITRRWSFCMAIATDVETGTQYPLIDINWHWRF